MLWNETTTGRRAHFAPLLALVLVVVGCSTPLSTREKGALVAGPARERPSAARRGTPARAPSSGPASGW